MSGKKKDNTVTLMKKPLNTVPADWFRYLDEDQVDGIFEEVNLFVWMVENWGFVPARVARRMMGINKSSNYIYLLARTGKLKTIRFDGHMYFSTVDCMAYGIGKRTGMEKSDAKRIAEDFCTVHKVKVEGEKPSFE